MQVVPCTHRRGQLAHAKLTDDRAVLRLQIVDGSFDPGDAVPLLLRSGQMSLHDDRLVHGSQANRSSRLRCGLTIRYSAGEVKVDTAIWPEFRSYWMARIGSWTGMSCV